GAAQIDGRGQPEHGVDLERDRQARRCLEPRGRLAGIHERLSAEPSDRRNLARPRRRHRAQRRSDHRSGRLVRSARAHRKGAGCRSRPQRAPLCRLRPPAFDGAAARHRALWRALWPRRAAGRRRMTDLPARYPGQTQLGLVIDLDLCVGCHACATACKEWNTGGHMAPLPDFNAYGDGAWGVWFNRIHSFEEGEGDGARTVHFPKSCLHCEDAACVTVCLPDKGAVFRRSRRSEFGGVGAGRGARRQRPDAGARLSPDQQIPAAAPRAPLCRGPSAAAVDRAPRRSAKRSRCREPAVALGRPPPVALSETMHPALSIVFFTTASGAGFALLFLLGLAAPLGLLPQSGWFGLVALATAFILAAAGLVSSVFHLGRPERAWRAFSQWRSSWLSREGVMSVLTFVPAAIFGIGWVFFGETGGLIGLCGVLAAICAAVTIACTG